MKIIKNIQCRITINDHKTIYNDDINKTILNLFNERYKGKCFSGVYIIQGNKIIKRGGCLVDKNSIDATISISIEIECDVIVYNTGDTIVATVMFIESNGNFIANNDHSAVYVSQENDNIVVKENDVIPLFVVECKYSLNQEKINVLAIPLIPYEGYIYRINKNANGIESINYDDNDVSININDVKKLLGYKDIKGESFDNIKNLKQDTIVTRGPTFFGDKKFRILKSSDSLVKENSTEIIDLNVNEVLERFMTEYMIDICTVIVLEKNYDIKKIGTPMWLKHYKKVDK